MESKFFFGPICGKPYPFIKFLPDNDIKIVSCIDNDYKP